MMTIAEIVDQIELFANQYVGVDPKLHHPDPCARLHGAGMLIDAEIMRRMRTINEAQKTER